MLFHVVYLQPVTLPQDMYDTHWWINTDNGRVLCSKYERENIGLFKGDLFVMEKSEGTTLLTTRSAAQLGVLGVTSVVFLTEVFNWNLILRR